MTKHLKFKTDQTNPESPTKPVGRSKAGKNNTQNIITAAGAVVIGGVAGATINHLVNSSNPDQPTHPVEPVDPVNPVHPEPDTSDHSAEAQQNPVHPHTDEPQTHQESEPLVESAQSQHENPVNSSVSQQPQPGSINPASGEPTPEQVAEALSSQIDANDIDAPDLLAVQKFETAYGPDGQEMNIAVATTPDGGEYLLADTDGDGVYESLFDTNGNFLVSVEANITHSDLEVSMQNGGGYLAFNEFDNSTPAPIQDGDVVVTDEPDDQGTDNILAQLIGPSHDDSSDDNHSENVIVESDDTFVYDSDQMDHDTADSDVPEDANDDAPLYV